MRKRIFRITLVAMTMLLVSSLFVACGLFDLLKTVTDVDVVAVEGLEKGDKDGEYYAVANGYSMILAADWHNDRVAQTDIEWHEVVDGNDSVIKSETGTTYSRGFSLDDVDKVFEYYVVVSKVKSSKITVRVKYVLQTPTIGANLPMTGDVVQQNLVDGAKDVLITATWNELLIPEGRVATLSWYVNGGKRSTGGEYLFDVSSITEECEFKIEARLSDGEQTKSASITLSFVKRYALAESVVLNVATDLPMVSQDTYYMKANIGDDKSVSFSTVLWPWNAKQDAPCKWTFTDSTGRAFVLDSEDRKATINLSYGKNVIQATIQNVESRKITVYALESDYDELPSNIKKHIANKFFWMGNHCDSYIASQADLNAYMGYAVSKHKTGGEFEAYIANSDWRTIDKLKEKCSDAITEGVDESGNFSYSLALHDSILSIKFSDSTIFGIPQGAYEPKANSEQIKGYLRYSEQSWKRTYLPVDSVPDTVLVENSNDLYRVVSSGRKPEFANNENGTKLKKLYDEARDVLATYVSGDMSEYEKVAAIYDWIVNVVDYDYAVASVNPGEENTSKYNAFYLEGVFNDHRAVCDGKSKAFALLCGMEGIKAVRVVGLANKNLKDLTPEQQAACGHAWNKVLIDANGDGEREWYVVDTTWGDLAVKKEGSKGMFEYLNYAYFLKTDEDIKDTHIAKTYAPPATTKLNVYKMTFVEIYGGEMDLYIESVAELQEIIDFSKSNGYIAACIYMTATVYDNMKSVNGRFGYISLGNNQYVIYARV